MCNGIRPIAIERNWTVKANYTRKPKAGGDSLNIVRVVTWCPIAGRKPRPHVC
jgi:hypothetical protein